MKSLSQLQSPMVAQYRNLIRTAISESETIQTSGSRLDIGKLCSRFKVIYKAAQFDGLTEDDVDTLIDEAMPQEFVNNKT